MKKLILASAIAAAFVGSVAHAEEAAPESTIAYNVGVATDYRYRGISQSQKDPALSAGADYTNNVNGLYVGTWLTTIKWIKATGTGNGVSTSGPVEWDIYGGKRGELGGGFSYDVGGLYYYYPGNDLSKVSASFANANTFELYGQLGYGPAYLKYSHALTNTFGNAGSKNSYYLDAGVNQPLAEGLTLNLHVGYQKLKNVTDGSYTDWKIGVTKDFGVVVGSIAYIDTNASKTFYLVDGVKTGTGTVVATLVKNF